jgi:serine/threonine protein kinase
MANAPSKIGPYTVQGQIGRGGMGVVFRGQDPKLGRAVALKALPPEFAAEPERLTRFEREAKVLASLSHPNVAGIYGIEEVSGATYLVLELVEGETLAERLARGPLPLEDALDLGCQLASGLEAAHEAGVIHRDIKPGNVMITPDGQVKILDFGLAKARDPEVASGSEPRLAESPTLTHGSTRMGVILGTAGYMSPEQARGRKVDRRADIWGLGCLLYEMASGKQAFSGENVSDTLAAVLRGEPDWGALPVGTSPALARLIRRCLEKDPKQRIRDAHDVRLDLEEILNHPASPGTPSPAGAGPRSHLRTAALAGAALLVGVLVGWAAWGLMGGGPSAASVVRLSAEAPADLKCYFAIPSRDLRTLAFIAIPRKLRADASRVPRLYLRTMDSFDAAPVAGTDNVQVASFSPDGAWLAYAAPVSALDLARLRLYKVPVDGSAPPVGLLDWESSWSPPLWLPDGSILVTTGPGRSLIVLPAGAASPSSPQKIDLGREVQAVDASSALPGGKGFLADVISYGPGGYQNGVAALDVTTGKGSLIVEDGGSAHFLPPDTLLFTRHDTLLAAPFDASALKVKGEAVALQGGLRTFNSWAPAPFAVSPKGDLAYFPGGTLGAHRTIALLSPDGRVEPWSDDRRALSLDLTPSPDGRRLEVAITNSEGIDEIFVSEVARPALRRLVAVPKADVGWAAWSRDGERIAFLRRGGNDQDGVYVVPYDGSQPPRRVWARASADVVYQPSAWTPDGMGIVAARVDRKDPKGHLALIPLAPGGAEPKTLFPDGYATNTATFSPDGRWIAFRSSETGTSEVYLSAWGAGGTVGQHLQVSNGGGARPMWGADGKTLSYVSSQGRIMTVSLQFAPEFSISRPLPGPDLVGAGAMGDERQLSRLPDGRFLFSQAEPGEDEVGRVDVVLNWSRELKAKTERKRK